MTLQEFFNYLSANPLWVIGYFLTIPLLSTLMGLSSTYKRNSNVSRTIYSILIFSVAIPGLLAVALNIYLFLFERRGIFNTNIYTQILPIVSFIATIFILKKQVALDEIPGFDKLSGLIIMIFAAFAIMWGLDRTRIHFIAFTYLPIQYVLAIFIGILFAIRIGWKKITK